MIPLLVIDIGTNSIVGLLSKKCKNEKIQVLTQKCESVRLGDNLEKTGKIHINAIQRTISVLEQYKQLAVYNNARIVVVGTHVFRAAENRMSVLEDIQLQTGLCVEVLTEAEEAKWSFWGAVFDRDLQNEVMLIDIGGGSTEWIIGIETNILQSYSFPIGALSLKERFVFHDPIQTEEIRQIEETVINQVQRIIKKDFYLNRSFIGVGGTITTLAALFYNQIQYNSDIVDGTVLYMPNIEKLYQKLRSSTIAERQRWLAFDPKRADIILIGTIILLTIMYHNKLDSIIVSDRGLQFGIVLREFKLNHMVKK